MLDEDHQCLESDKKEGTSEEQPNLVADDDPSRLVRPEVRQGKFPGNERIVFVRPAHPAFRRLGSGLLEATEVTEAPHGVLGHLKRLVIGTPIPTTRAEYEYQLFRFSSPGFTAGA